MSDFDKITRIRTPDEAHRALVEACKRGRLRMSVPASVSDDDMVIGQAIDQWKRDRDHAAALAKALGDALVWLETELRDADTDTRRERLEADVAGYRSTLAAYEAEKGAK